MQVQSTGGRSGTAAVTVTAVGATNEILIGNTGADPSWSSSPTVTTINATTFDTNVAAAGVTLVGTTLSADGTDANIDITITPKGTASIKSLPVYNYAVGATNRAMLVDNSGYIGNATSSLRFKKDIEDMGNKSSDILKLRPVTFKYKDDVHEREKFGLIAEEVAKILPELVSFDEYKQPYTVSYHELPPLLLNELQKLHKRVLHLENRLSLYEHLLNAKRVEHGKGK